MLHLVPWHFYSEIKGEETYCQRFSPYFWSELVPDYNNDGIKTIEERIKFATSQGKQLKSVQYFSPFRPQNLKGTIQLKNVFSQSIATVHSAAELKKVLQEQLDPSQQAIITFSADWCSACRGYRPDFEKLAQTYQGQYLLIWAEGIGGYSRKSRDRNRLATVWRYYTLSDHWVYKYLWAVYGSSRSRS